MRITVENIESFMLIVVRLSAFFFAAPITATSVIPRKFKVGLAFFMSLVVYNSIEVNMPAYTDVISFAIIIMEEVITGVILGYITNACIYIVNFSGRFIDMEIGLSMANMMDPSTRLQASITGTFYTQMVTLLLLISNMHYYLIRAIIDSFRYVPLGGAVFKAGLYEIFTDFIVDFFIIGFRIVLPIFAAMLILNVVLGVLARIAPQMNMFVIGMQLKVLGGLIILSFIVSTLPMVADFLFDEMKKYLDLMMKAITP